MGRDFDLLGDPIPDNWGKPGANGHVATAANVKKIRLLLVAGLTLERIADEIGVSVPTLRKHYFQNGRVSRSRARAAALAEARAANLLQLQARADDGSVAALNAIRQIIEREGLAAMDDEISRPGARGRDSKAARGRKADPVSAPRPVPAGKKQIDELAAREAEREFGSLLDGGKVH